MVNDALTDNKNISNETSFEINHGYQKISRCPGADISEGLRINTGRLSVEIVVEGEGVHCFERKIIPCKVNDLYIIPPGVSHGYFVNDASKSLTVRVLSFCIDDWLRAEATTAGTKKYCYGVFREDPILSYAMLNTLMRQKVDGIFDFVEYELQERGESWKDMVRSWITLLLCSVSRYVNSSIKTAQIRTSDSEITQEALRILECEFKDGTLSLENIAKRVFISPSRLSRFFKAYTGQLFSDYLRDKRLKYSAELLANTDFSVDKIVLECGLGNASAFYRNFKNLYGMTPQNYRQVIKISDKKTKTSYDKRGEKIMVILSEISENLQKGKAKIVKELVQQAIDEGADPEKILNEGLLAGMSVIGEKFKNNEVYVPEVLVAARAMNAGAQILKPYLAEKDVATAGKVCIGTVRGDLHDIGKNLVKMMMEGKGLEVIDLGTDVSPETFVKTAIEENCQIICCSALLTTTMSVMADVVKEAENQGIRDKVTIMIGGAPVSEEFRQKVGADIYTSDAASAADAAVECLKK